MSAQGADKVEMLSITTPGSVTLVDAGKYHAVREALLAVLPPASPGLTAAEMKQRLLPLLPEALFPGGAKAGWWMKGVQLDLEARELIVREAGKPLRFHRI